jgi:16S rRNA (uracil1498-N3)-methyltransferase
MSLPYFFTEQLSVDTSNIILEEETSKHIVQVLRMNAGEKLLLTDGKGLLSEAVIAGVHKKHCTVNIIKSTFTPTPEQRHTIAISIIKNASRFEWFLEKATELGIYEIIPLLCERTERQKIRQDRFINICKSAMLQSMQTRIPLLTAPTNFDDVVTSSDHQQKLIAHCAEDDKRSLAVVIDQTVTSHIILIGPEGDFTTKEIEKAKSSQFVPVSLGNTRLRTETAGIYAAVVLTSLNR